MSEPLSPTAQAVLDALTAFLPAARPAKPGCKRAMLTAAAIRALVDAKLPKEGMHEGFDIVHRVERQRLRREVLAVADELEGKE